MDQGCITVLQLVKFSHNHQYLTKMHTKNHPRFQILQLEVYNSHSIQSAINDQCLV